MKRFQLLLKFSHEEKFFSSRLSQKMVTIFPIAEMISPWLKISAPTAIPAKSEIYTFLVIRASPIAKTGGISDQYPNSMMHLPLN
ncbi:hypothetical protein SDC9_212872 [bioreactor metagenome]|uniref:Uncharacterized protein n=1 Tax=bioreactor metagenome TaxID=1076179 RepID=A0A645K205_9ZZZZ